MRLTGIENDRCSIELFVFGSQRAEAPRFKAEFCGVPTERELAQDDNLYSQTELFVSPPRPGAYRLFDPETRRLAFPASVTTKLIGSLTPREMQVDAWIRWVPFESNLPTYYGREAARSLALNWFVGIAVLGLITLQALAPRLSSTARIRSAYIVMGLAFCFGIACYAALPTRKVERTREPPVAYWRMLDGALQQYALEQNQKKASLPTNFVEFTTALDQYHTGGALNMFTGEPLKNEPTPGNVTLNFTTNGVDVFWYDIAGGAHWMVSFTNAPVDRPLP